MHASKHRAILNWNKYNVQGLCYLENILNGPIKEHFGFRKTCITYFLLC